MKNSMIRTGYTMLEILIVVAIIAFLAMLGVPAGMRYVAKAKRAEAYMNLGALCTAEKAYWIEHSTYTTALRGADSAGWEPEGYSGGGANEKFFYTYGFAQGSEGRNYFTGKNNTPASALQGTQAGKDSFVAAAAADIDGDNTVDLLTINQVSNIIIVQDDLA